MKTLSVVTVAMNRTDHLSQCAEKISKIGLHVEHIILDFGSQPPVERVNLPDDPRISLHRVRNESGQWWLTHSYNLAFALAQGDYILKVDADALLDEDFFCALFSRISEKKPDLLCARLTRQEWSMSDDFFITNGLFACKSSSLKCIRGFNPYIQGWGWDELDLFSRFFLSGFSVTRIPSVGVEWIDHDDSLRGIEYRKSDIIKDIEIQSRVDLAPAKKAFSEKNRQIALRCIAQNVLWPDFKDYVDYFFDKKSLPKLKSINIFKQSEMPDFHRDLVRRLLSPSRSRDALFRILQNLGLGPYSCRGAARIVSKSSLDLKLVCEFSRV